MNSNEKKLMPESLYSLDNDMSLEKLLRAKEIAEPVIGKVLMYHFASQTFDVDLGNGFFGILPLNVASIYPTLSADGQLSASLKYIIGRNIVVSISCIDTTNDSKPIITLSRSNLMMEQFKTLSHSIGESVECCITAIVHLGLFVDLGNGITGLIYYKNLCISRVENFSELGFSVGDKITAKIISADENYHINLDYKEQFPNLAFILEENDLIVATVLSKFNEDGYFAYVNPNTFAVIDIPIDITYGTKVVARVKKTSDINPTKLRLQFVSFV